MNFSAWILISVLSASICTVTISGESINSKRKSSKKEDKQLFIDDTEGSGFEPDTKTDMVYSGSGYGPDDEDAPLNPPTDVLTRNENRGSNEKGGASIANNNDNDGKESKHEQTLPMPTPKSTATTSTTTREPEPPSVEVVNTKPEEPENVAKVPVEKPSEPKIDPADKSPVDDNINNNNNGVYVVNTPNADRTTSFFAQPGILAAVIGGAVVGLLCAILVVMFIVYRMRKKDEGSYPLEDMKRCPATNPYIKPNHREFFA